MVKRPSPRLYRDGQLRLETLQYRYRTSVPAANRPQSLACPCILPVPPLPPILMRAQTQTHTDFPALKLALFGDYALASSPPRRKFADLYLQRILRVWLCVAETIGQPYTFGVSVDLGTIERGSHEPCSSSPLVGVITCLAPTSCCGFDLKNRMGTPPWQAWFPKAKNSRSSPIWPKRFAS